MGDFTGKNKKENYSYKKTEAKHANVLNIYFAFGTILQKILITINI